MVKRAAAKSGIIFEAVPPAVIIPLIFTPSAHVCLKISIPLKTLIIAVRALIPSPGSAEWAAAPLIRHQPRCKQDPLSQQYSYCLDDHHGKIDIFKPIVINHNNLSTFGFFRRAPQNNDLSIDFSIDFSHCFRKPDGSTCRHSGNKIMTTAVAHSFQSIILGQQGNAWATFAKLKCRFISCFYSGIRSFNMKSVTS